MVARRLSLKLAQRRQLPGLWAWVASRGGRDVLLAEVVTRTKHVRPLVRTTRREAEKLRGDVQSFADVEGVEVRLVRFTRRRVVLRVKPQLATPPQLNGRHRS